MAFGAPDWRNPILWVCAVLSSIWQLLQRLVERYEDVHHFEPLLFSGLASKTVKLYQREVRDFVGWLEQLQRQPVESHEFDDALTSYMRLSRCPMLGKGRLTRPRAEHLVAGMERVLPRLKGKLSYTRQLLRDWGKTDPVNHTTAEPWEVSLAVGNHLGAMGFPRVGCLHVLQACTGMRPSELLGLRREDLRPTWLSPTGAPQTATISLGTRGRPTKAKRAQWISLSPTEDPVGCYLIAAFYLGTRPGEKLSAVETPTEYNRLLALACKAWNISDLHITGHSARAGWATRLRQQGVPFPEVKEKGRWTQDTSLRTYLDVIGAQNISERTMHMRPTAEWIMGDFATRFAMFPDAPPPRVIDRIASCGKGSWATWIRPLNLAGRR